MYAQMIRRWIDEGIKPLAISINVTKTDLLAMDVVEIFDELLKNTGYRQNI